MFQFSLLKWWKLFRWSQPVRVHVNMDIILEYSLKQIPYLLEINYDFIWLQAIWIFDVKPNVQFYKMQMSVVKFGFIILIKDFGNKSIMWLFYLYLNNHFLHIYVCISLYIRYGNVMN